MREPQTEITAPPGRSLAKRMMGIAAPLILAYFVILFLAVLFESRFIYFPQIPGRLSGDWSPRDLPLEEVWFETADNVRLHAWWIQAQNAEFTFLAFHGNAANIANRADVYRFLRALPANVLAVEYRGYGRSEGRPTEAGLYLDGDAAYNFLLRERGVPPRRVIAFGQSLGSAVAADLASRHEVGGVVLEAPFASARAVARRLYWFLPGLSLVMRTRFDTGRKLEQLRVPVLIVHCTEDPVIGLDFGEEVFSLARQPKQMLQVEGYCHEEASLVDPGRYRAALIELLGKIRAAEKGERAPRGASPRGN